MQGAPQLLVEDATAQGGPGAPMHLNVPPELSGLLSADDGAAAVADAAAMGATLPFSRLQVPRQYQQRSLSSGSSSGSSSSSTGHVASAPCSSGAAAAAAGASKGLSGLELTRSWVAICHERGLLDPTEPQQTLQGVPLHPSLQLDLPPGLLTFGMIQWATEQQQHEGEARTVWQAHIPLERAPDFILGEEARGRCQLLGHRRQKPPEEERKVRSNTILFTSHFSCHSSGTPKDLSKWQLGNPSGLCSAG